MENEKKTPPKSNQQITNHCATLLTYEIDLSDEAVFFFFLIKTLVVFIQVSVSDPPTHTHTQSIWSQGQTAHLELEWMNGLTHTHTLSDSMNE